MKKLKNRSVWDYYDIKEKLGEGAFGYVRKVIHKASRMVIAMKQIRKAATIKEEEENMFGELKILRKLDHPNILKVYDLF